MDEQTLKNIVAMGETSKVQFKEALDNNDKIADEFIAMANSKGGTVIFGVKDKTGEVVGLDYDTLQKTNSKVADIATNLIKPQLFIETESISIGNSPGRGVLLVNIDEGVSKPYKDNQGRIWLKQGSDKRILTDNNEQVRLFQQSELVYVDEMVVPDTDVQDIREKDLENYLSVLDEDNPQKPDVATMQNINVLKGGKLTLGGLMFFGENPQKYRPGFCVKAISFFGNDIGETDYRDSSDITGTIPEMFEQCMSFFNRNLLHTQQGQNFNSVGILEISKIALEELVQNALTHRDYTKNSPIRLFIFENRVEIISPGALPNSLTIENIKMGNAVMRNPLITTFASRTMKYRGIGSGIRRAIKHQKGIVFENDTIGEQFKITIPREKLVRTAS